jgi:hypothetical protein
MRRMGAFFAVPAVVAGFFVSPLWSAPHHSHRYQQGRIEKVSVEENGALHELSGQDTSPVEPNTRYVVVVNSGNAKYSGEFQVQSKNAYPITLRPGQKIRFWTSQEQMFACDVHAVMMLVTSTYLVMRDPQGKDWYLFVSGGLPPDFNADLRQGSAFDDASSR